VGVGVEAAQVGYGAAEVYGAAGVLHMGMALCW